MRGSNRRKTHAGALAAHRGARAFACAVVGFAAAWAVACMGFAPSEAAYADEGAQGLDFEPGEVLVVQKHAATPQARIKAMCNVVNGFDVESFDELGTLPGTGSIVNVRLAEEERADELVSSLAGDPSVSFAQRNYRYYLFEDLAAEGAEGGAYAAGRLAALDDDGDGEGGDEVPSPATDDPSLSRQYYLESWEDSHGAGVIEAWDTVKSDRSVTIAVLDTGVRPTHEDLAGNLDTAHMVDIVKGTNPGTISAVDEHGSHTAGIAGAVANNGKGIAGASYNANILPIQVFATSYTGDYTDTAWLIEAYEYLIGLVESGELDDLHVINMSLGGYSNYSNEDAVLEEAIKSLREDYDVLTVCAGGNGSNGRALTSSSWPSDYESSFSVTALGTDGNNTAWSDYNLAKDISAPGEAIYSTVSGNDSAYAEMDGTSMASPLVAGIAALLWAAEPNLTVDQVVEALQTTAHPLNASGANYHTSAQTGSAGAIDAAAAVQYVEENYVNDARLSLRNAVVTVNDEAFYTGQAVTPEVTVEYEGKALTEHVDYELEYRNNVNAGTATVQVKAAEDSELYRGSQNARFTIYYDLSNEAFASADAQSARTFTGRALTPIPRLYYDGETLVRGTDFTTSYEDNIYGPTAHIICEGTGLCRGRYVVDFEVLNAPAGANDLLDAIAEAQALLDATEVSDDGTGVAEGGRWATQEAHDQLSEVIEGMQAMYGEPRHVQEDFETAIEALLAAQEAFEDASHVVEPAPADPDDGDGGDGGDGNADSGAGSGGNAGTGDDTGAGGNTDNADSGKSGGASKPSAPSDSSAAPSGDSQGDSSSGGSSEGSPNNSSSDQPSDSAPADQSSGSSGGDSPSVPETRTYEPGWHRLSGEVALDTMVSIVREGFDSSDAVVLATLDGYWDALAASALAGKLGAPVLLTASTSLSPQTAAEIARLGASQAYIVGGAAAVSADVESQVSKALVGSKTVTRLAGENAQETALAIAAQARTAQSDTCVIATSAGYWDALSASPFAYAKNAPIYLTDAEGNLSDSVLQAIAAAGYKRAVIAGGTAAVSDATEGSLRSAGISDVIRQWGANAYATSGALAVWEIQQGMSANGAGAATATGYWDALCGAALCGSAGSVLVLIDDGNDSNLSVLRANADAIDHAYAFGGVAAVSPSTLYALQQATE